jgi:hypothetical protein
MARDLIRSHALPGPRQREKRIPSWIDRLCSELEKAGRASTQFTESDQRPIETLEVLRFFWCRITALDDMRRHDQKPRRRAAAWIEQEREMRGPLPTSRLPIALVCGEERWKPRGRSKRFLHSCHHRSTQCPRDLRWLRALAQPVFDHERMDVVTPIERTHDSQTEKAAIADHQWSTNRLGEGDLDMPEPIWCEASARCEGLRLAAVTVEGLSLNPDDLRGETPAGVTQRMYNGSCRASLLTNPPARP